MVGRQVGFYLLKPDALALFRHLARHGPRYVLLPEFWNEPRVSPIESGMPVFDKRVTHFQGDMIRPEDVGTLQLKQAKSGVWYASRLDHPVIEVSLSTGKVDKKLPGSRLYYTKTYQYGLGPLKSPEFLDWADRVFREAKRFFQHRNAYGYVGEKAHQWLLKGGQIANW